MRDGKEEPLLLLLVWKATLSSLQNRLHLKMVDVAMAAAKVYRLYQ